MSEHEKLSYLKPTCSCGYECKTQAGLLTHIKYAVMRQQITALTAENERLKKENDRWKNDVQTTETALGISALYAKQDEEIERLQKEVEDLKCCGNCNLWHKRECNERGEIEHPHYTEFTYPRENQHFICWQSDNLTRKEREG
jgi:FtsZ-binding cell division protein ZapB